MKQRVVYSFSVILLQVLFLSVAAQEIAITGNVSSGEDGLPLIGVNVVVKGTMNGTVTDREGNYSINAGGGSVLEFSSIGYESQEIAVGNRTQIDVIMQEAKFELQEVVVTALGIQKEKKALGYAVQEVEGTEFEKAKEPNVISSSLRHGSQVWWSITRQGSMKILNFFLGAVTL